MRMLAPSHAVSNNVRGGPRVGALAGAGDNTSDSAASSGGVTSAAQDLDVAATGCGSGRCGTSAVAVQTPGGGEAAVAQIHAALPWLVERSPSTDDDAGACCEGCADDEVVAAIHELLPWLKPAGEGTTGRGSGGAVSPRVPGLTLPLSRVGRVPVPGADTEREPVSMEYELQWHPEPPDAPAKDPCGDARDRIVAIQAVDWSLSTETEDALSCPRQVYREGATGVVESGSIFDSVAGWASDLGEGLYTKIPSELSRSTCSLYCRTDAPFDTEGAVWTYIHARRQDTAEGQASTDQYYNYCGVGFDSYDATASDRQYFVNAFVPYLAYTYELEYGAFGSKDSQRLGSQPCVGWFLKVRFWTGMINNFSVYRVTLGGERVFRTELTREHGTNPAGEVLPYAWLGWRAWFWFSGIHSTTATIRVAKESSGAYQTVADSKTWTCDLSGELGYRDAAQLCNAPHYADDQNFIRLRDLSTLRQSSLGNMLRGEVHFSPSYWPTQPLSGMIEAAFQTLFGSTIQCEQRMDYLPAPESAGGEMQTAVVRACLTFADAEPLSDLLARVDALNDSNKDMFQTSDIAALAADTFAASPAGTTASAPRGTCEFW